MSCPTHGKATKAYCPDCASSLPRARFSYGDAVDIPKRSRYIYGLEQVRQCIVSLEPVQTRMRVRGVDHRISQALNALKQAEILLEEADGNGHD